MKHRFLAIGAALVSTPALAHHENIASGAAHFANPLVLTIFALSAFVAIGYVTRNMIRGARA